MALKEIAVVGATLQVQVPVTGSAVFSGPPSVKNKGGGQFAYLDQVQVTVPPGATNGTCTTTVPGIGNMPATAVKVSDINDTKKILRVDDEVTIYGITGILSGGGACTLNVTVKVTNAGQSKVKAE